MSETLHPSNLSRQTAAERWRVSSSGFLPAFVHFGLYSVTEDEVIREGKQDMAEHSSRSFARILPLFYFAWMLCPRAYLMPVLMRFGVSYEFTIVGK